MRAIQEGADHFLTKTLDLSALTVVVERPLDQRRTRRRLRAHDERRVRMEVDPFDCTSSAVRRLAEQARHIAACESARSGSRAGA